jgi:hypothetical protein
MEKITFKNIKAYIQGHIRYRLYYSKYKWLIPLHIREQIDMRIYSMNEECFKQGSCIKCGCQTTHLQMANKKCDGECYPEMLSLIKWNYLKKNSIIVLADELWIIKKGLFKKIEKNGLEK